MRILILGGTGAMGSELVPLLQASGAEVDVTTRRDHIDGDRIHYLKGNALEMDFLNKVLKNSYDAIIDFMAYDLPKFSERYTRLLHQTKQYLFLSSARVYAQTSSEELITENTPRLLDVCTDAEYLAKSEYALDKARQENLLLESKEINWTIIRPYITYNTQRLQLGTMELNAWLYRALHGQSILFSKDVASKYTSMTYGKDVADIIAKLIGNEKAKGEIYQIAGPDSMHWHDVLNVYLDTIEKYTGCRPPVVWQETGAKQAKVLGNKYQWKYDRMFDRRFSSQKVANLVGKINYTSMAEGLEQCLSKFIQESYKIEHVDLRYQAYCDHITGERTSLDDFAGNVKKFYYFLFRFSPSLARDIEKIVKKR